ncbi:MAG: CvpA family protein [Candidatus Sericytochromatia bacterium]|nr:CvpA family protein [Candidatus Sericytochromatia bacterium]
MLKPPFVDFLLISFFLIFTAKGFVTGSIRSVVTLVALALGWFFAALMPAIAGFAIGYLLPDSSANYLLINRLAAIVIFFGLFQSIGFLLTGLFENIHLGGFDKFLGFLLGLTAAFLVVPMPGAAIMEIPTAWAHKPNHRYFVESKVMKAARPLSVALARKVSRRTGAQPR